MRKEVVNSLVVCMLTCALQSGAVPATGVVASAAESANTNVKDLKRSVEAAIAAGNFDEAISALLRAHKLEPKDDAVEKLLSRAYFEKAKSIQADPTKALDEVCKAYFYDDDVRDVSLLKSKLCWALKKNPDKFDDVRQLGDAAAARGEREAAIVHYSQALALKDDPQLLEARTKILKELGLPFWPAVDTEGVDYNGYMMTAQRWIRSVWLPPRGKESTRVVVLFTVSRNGRISNPRVTKSSGDAETDSAALKTVSLVSPLRPLPAGSDDTVDIQFFFDYNNLAGKKPGQNQTLEGLAFYEKGKTEFLKGNYSQAIEHLEKAVASAAGRPSYLFTDRLIDALLACGDAAGKGDPCKALPYYQRALNLDPAYSNSNERWKQAVSAMGVDVASDEAVIAFAKKLETAGDAQGALAAYKVLINRGNKQSDVIERRAAMEKRLGSDGVAKRWRDYIERNPNSVEAHLGLAIALKDLGDIAGALKEFTRVLELDSNNESAKENIKSLTSALSKQTSMPDLSKETSTQAVSKEASTVSKETAP